MEIVDYYLRDQDLSAQNMDLESEKQLSPTRRASGHHNILITRYHGVTTRCFHSQKKKMAEINQSRRENS